MNQIKIKAFTLLELVITLSILSIVVAFAIPSFSEFIKSQKVSNETNDLLADISLTRITSLNTGLRCILEPVIAGDWDGDRRIYIDRDSDGAFNDASDELIRISQDKDSGLIITGPVNVSFDFQGALDTTLSVPPILFSITVKNYSKNKQLTVALSGLTNIQDGENEA